jgi:hypothetical protein
MGKVEEEKIPNEEGDNILELEVLGFKIFH